MAENRTTFQVWSWPHNGDPFVEKFPITAYVTDYEFSAEYGVGGGDGVLHLDATFARLTEILNRDHATPANDHASIIVVFKDGVPYRPYVASRLPKTISSEATSVPLTIRSMSYFLDKARVGPFDHNPLVADSVNPNPTLDPDWEYGAESVLRFGDSISNEVQQIWRSTGMSSGTFTLTDGTDVTASINWDASAGTIQTRLQDDIAAIVDVTVSGDGTDVAPWEIEFLDPSGDIPFTIEIGTNSTNGVFSTDTLREGGSLDPSPWTQSQNPVTKVVHGNYQTFDIVDDTIAPAAAFPSGDTYVLRIDVDSLGEVGTDYGGAQQVVQVDGGSRWRAGCWVYSPGEAKRFRIVVRSMDETTAFNSKDFDVPADTLFFLDMPAINIPSGVSEVIYRIGILEPTNVGVAYIAIQSAILAPGFPPRPWGYIVNDLKVDIGFRTSLFDWVTTTWTLTNDSSGVAWDRDLSWEINLRQSLQQLCEISHEWGYESTGIYWSVANSRFEWGCYNPGNGGTDRTNTGFKIGMGDAMTFGEKVSRVPETTEAWAFGTNMKWGRATDATMVSKWGVLESMALDRQGQDTMDVLAAQMVQDSELESAVQKIRIHFARITPGIDFDIGDYLDIDMGPVGVVGVFRVAGIVEGKTEDGEEYADIHLGALVKSPEVAQADAVRTMWRKLDTLEGGKVKNRVVEPAQTSIPPPTGKGRPIIVAAADAPDDWKAAADYECTGTAGNPIDKATIEQAISDAHATGGLQHAHIRLSPGKFFVNTDSGAGIAASKSNGVTIEGSGIWMTQIIGITVNDGAPTRYIVNVGNFSNIRNLSVIDDTFPANTQVYGISLGTYSKVENVYGYGKGWLTTTQGNAFNSVIDSCVAEYNGGLFRANSTFVSPLRIVNCSSEKYENDGLGNIEFGGATISTLVIQGNYLSSAGDSWAIRFDGGSRSAFSNVIQGNTLFGGANAGFGCIKVVIASTGFFTENTIADNFMNGDTAIQIIGTGGTGDVLRNNIANNIMWTASATDVACVQVQNVDLTSLHILGNSITGGGNYGIFVDQDTRIMRNVWIANNELGPSFDLASIYVEIDANLQVIDNHMQSGSNYALQVVGVDGPMTVKGNQIDGNGSMFGFRIDQCPNALVVANHIYFVNPGIYLTGVSITGEGFLVADNLIRVAHTGTSHSGIEIDGTYGRGMVKGNVIIPDATVTAMPYGIDPQSASASALIVVGNDIRGTWGTAPINVTNSPIVDYPADATYGDNFT